MMLIQVALMEKNKCGLAINNTQVAFKRELDAVRNLDYATDRSWRVINSNIEPNPGYDIDFGSTNGSLHQVSSAPVADNYQFMQHHLFVTKYHGSEQYPIGDYPIQRGRDVGLGQYIKANEKILNDDVVVWCTLFHVYEPTTETYPTIPATIPSSVQTIKLSPHNFFPVTPGKSI